MRSPTLPDLIADPQHQKLAANRPGHSRTPSSSSLQHEKRIGSRLSIESSSSAASAQYHQRVPVDDRPFTLYSPVQNIVSACTDPTRSRTETSVFFTRHWGEHFLPGASIPPPPPSSNAFHATSARQRKQNEEAVATHIFLPYIHSFGKRLHQHKKQYRAMIAEPTVRTVVDDDDEALAVIPKIFMNSSFDLTKRATFEEVFMRASSSSHPRDNCDDQSSTFSSVVETFVSKEHLSEKLETYHDLIEHRLNKQLASKSRQFFTAVDTYNSLTVHLRETAASVKRLRTMTERIDKGVVQRSLRALWLNRAHANYRRLLGMLRQCTTLREAQMTVQCFLSIYDYPSALDIIGTTQAILNNELSRVSCFKSLSTQLNELYKVIGKMLQEEFVRIVKEHLGADEASTTLLDSCHNVDEQQLNPVLIGLVRVREFRFVHVLVEEAAVGAKMLVRRVVRNYTSSALAISDLENDSASIAGDLDKVSDTSHSSTPARGGLADEMRKMNLVDWVDLLRQLLAAAEMYLCRVCALHQHLLSVIAECASTNEAINLSTSGALSASLSPSEAAAVDEQLRPMYGPISDAVEDRLARVLHARAKDGFFEQLTANEFVSIYNLVDAFCTRAQKMRAEATHVKYEETDSDDELSPRALQMHAINMPTSALRSCMRVYVTAIVNHFHAERRQKLTNIIDTELWRAAEVPARFQRIATHCTTTGRLSEREACNDSSISLEETTSPTPPAEILKVGDEEYAVCGTSLLLMRMMAQYCDCATLLPVASAELLSRLVELLKSFNSRTCQLILGAGAITLVGLKTITVRHLALASRCLQLIAHYITVVEEQFRRCIPAQIGTGDAPQLRHLKQLLGDYKDHVNEINMKLVSVVDYQMTAAIAKWQLQGKAPSPTFLQIGKHMRRFYESLNDILPGAQISTLMRDVHDNFRRALRAKLFELDVTPQRDANTYGFVCSEFSYYMEVMHTIPCCAQFTDTMSSVMTMQL